jgi:predicted acyltransferase
MSLLLSYKFRNDKMRLASIDTLRAITMVLMIWVNDFWALTNVPKWLLHAKAQESYLGFSDIIFPLFLFIVGLSIPFAIENRLAKGDKKSNIIKHILIRSFSLLLLGLYTVNYESTDQEAIIIGKYFWCILLTAAIFLIWTNWKKSPLPIQWHSYPPIIGFGILLGLAGIYSDGQMPDSWMKIRWWGILGLIGWAYLANALFFLYAKKEIIFAIALWILFNLLSVLDHAEMFISIDSSMSLFSTLYKGTIPAFTTAGMVAILLFKKLSKKNIGWAYGCLCCLGLINITYGWLTEPYWGISKIQATPSWLAICSGIGFLLFPIFHYLTDVKKATKWFQWIAPAGTATLTCYMLPYIIYPIFAITGFQYPSYLNNGIIGLLISFGFALTIVFIVGRMQKNGLSLKL